MQLRRPLHSGLACQLRGRRRFARHWDNGYGLRALLASIVATATRLGSDEPCHRLEGSSGLGRAVSILQAPAICIAPEPKPAADQRPVPVRNRVWGLSAPDLGGSGTRQGRNPALSARRCAAHRKADLRVHMLLAGGRAYALSVGSDVAWLRAQTQPAPEQPARPDSAPPRANARAACLHAPRADERLPPWPRRASWRGIRPPIRPPIARSIIIIPSAHRRAGRRR
eukprot:scaffold1208_cov299-Prasinococcus_capsulatus_cf.AAC.3